SRDHLCHPCRRLIRLVLVDPAGQPARFHLVVRRSPCRPSVPSRQPVPAALYLRADRIPPSGLRAPPGPEPPPPTPKNASAPSAPFSFESKAATSPPMPGVNCGTRTTPGFGTVPSTPWRTHPATSRPTH